MNQLSEIEGLQIIAAGVSSPATRTMPRKVSISEVRPMNMVFHGHGKRFSYEYFGIHRGTEDRLTFIGDERKTIASSFIDCREGSRTWGKRLEVTLRPSIDQILLIPPGVAHTFEGLEDIYTFNSFLNFLPDPNDWISGQNEWSLAADTINLPRNISDAELPRIRANTLEASDLFYEITSSNIASQNSDKILEYPLIRRMSLSDGSSKLLEFTKTAAQNAPAPKVEEIPGLKCACWCRRSFVTGNDDFDSGYTTFIRPNQLIIFDPGSPSTTVSSRDFPTYGEKRFTFFGPASANVCLSVNGNGGEPVVFTKSPSPFRELVVDAHAEFEFTNMTNVVLVAQQASSQI